MANNLEALLQPSREGKSYPQIAQRCNQWLRESNRGVASVSSEAIRKIYKGDVVRPDRVYLEAIAATQDVPLDLLLDAAGYPPSDPFFAAMKYLKQVDVLPKYSLDELKKQIERIRAEG